MHVLTFAKRIDDAIFKVYEEHYNCASEPTKSMGIAIDVKFDEDQRMILFMKLNQLTKKQAEE